MFLELLLLGAVLLYFFYRWATKNNDFFEKRGIPYHKPFPLLGSMKDSIMRTKCMFDNIIDLYNMHDGKVFGVFDQRVPMLLIKDPEIIKQITIKDFDHFLNHRTVFNDSDDNLFGNSLFSMHDAKWKDMRTTLSPVFTGSKLRQMFQLMNSIAENTVEYLKLKPGADSKEGVELDVKDFCTRFTNDIIASTAFGLQVNSLKDTNNEFYTMGKKVTTFTAAQNLKFFLFANFKFIMKLLKMEIFDKKQCNYFMRLVLDAIKYRKENNIIRPDMINMLMEAKGIIKSDHPKAHSRDWTDVEIVAQCFVFFFAGFETTAVLMCLAAHELMENPDVQKRLYEEIQEVATELNDKPLTYEKIQGMKYMDMVVNETLRKWPAAIAIDRVCNKDFEYTTNDGEKIEIKKDECLWIPVVGLHRDPKYFPNPMKFDPERFSDVNKDSINPSVYLPFGIGPRNCIGSRFALLEAKAILYYLLRDFRFEPAAKSSIPLKLSTNSFQIIPEGGYWIKFIARK